MAAAYPRRPAELLFGVELALVNLAVLRSWLVSLPGAIEGAAAMLKSWEEFVARSAEAAAGETEPAGDPAAALLRRLNGAKRRH
jgi:hypothetical protein